ncbi:MAG: ABC transporter ATP-binding protein [Acidimicrobiaceae bacterium]|nr:ABC transporter ATP-binding protein [Acidimicrobiaceae bacterium]
MFKFPVKTETLRKLWSLIPQRTRPKALWQVLLMFVGSGLELIGIGLIVPIVTVITNSSAGSSNSILQPIYDQFGIVSNNSMVVFALVMLGLTFLVKSIFAAYLSWSQIQFARQIEQDISNRLFRSFIERPYLFHLQRNSADLVNTVNSETVAVQGSFLGILSLVTELLVVIALGVLILYAEPIASVATVLLLVVASFAYNRVVRRRLTLLGLETKKHAPLKMQYAMQGFGGIKDVKVLGRGENFTDQFVEQNFLVGQTLARYSLLGKFPAIWIEFVAVLGLIVTILVMLAQANDPMTIAPVLGLLAAVSFRFVPSANRVIIATNSMRYTLPAINSVCNELQSGTEKVDLTHVGTLKTSIEMRNLTFSYPNTARPSLRDVNIVVHKGETVGFIGPSGAGKSTLVDVILGLLPPTSGELLIDGVDMHKNNLEWQSTIGYVAQAIYLTDDTVRRNVAFGIAERDIDEVALERALKSAQLWEFVQGLPDKTHTIVGERGVRVSGGQRQRIGIARALYHEPEVLVLDEATSSLDIETETEVMSAIRALQGFKTILIVAHRLSTVQHCDRVYKIEDSAIVSEGTLEQVTNAPN